MSSKDAKTLAKLQFVNKDVIDSEQEVKEFYRERKSFIEQILL